MRTPRVYLPDAQQAGSELPLPGEAARHLTKVLRLEPGHPVVAFNGHGGEFAGRLGGTAKQPTVTLERFHAHERESPLATELWAGLSKGEKFDWVVQKATELGASVIRPVATGRSVRRLDAAKAAKNRDRWMRIAASACEQCGRNRLPAIAPVAALDAALAEQGGPGLVLDETGAPPTHAAGDAPLRLLVGPEGGLTPEEIAAAEAAGFTRTALGPRTLRTETAAVAALAWAQTVWGDFPVGTADTP